MLFHVKRYLSLEIAVTILLGGLGLWGMRALDLPISLRPSRTAFALGISGSVFLGLWTLLVQYGYRLFRGRAYAENLTAALAKYFAHPSPAQVLLGGITAACGEELFFRGFIQQALGLAPAALLFMLAHVGRKDIRVIGYWSVFQGLYLGLFFAWTDNLLVPMLAHGLFDIGGMLYFRSFAARSQHATLPRAA